MPTIHELVHGKWNRLYLDVEIEFEDKQREDYMCDRLSDILQIVWRQLVKLTGLSQSDKRLKNSFEAGNHRWKTGADGVERWTMSFHVIFSDILFEHNSIGMKHFIQKILAPEIEKDYNLVWIKQCKQETQSRIAIDIQPYTHEQSF